jgi:hypothetical protein
VTKVYVEERGCLLRWIVDADEFGTFIDPTKKHKGPIGRLVR